MHTSGHAYEETILNVCKEIKPDVIFPIHSEKPDRLEELIDELVKSGALESKVIRLTNGKSVELK